MKTNIQDIILALYFFIGVVLLTSEVYKRRRPVHFINGIWQPRCNLPGCACPNHGGAAPGVLTG